MHTSTQKVCMCVGGEGGKITSKACSKGQLKPGQNNAYSSSLVQQLEFTIQQEPKNWSQCAVFNLYASRTLFLLPFNANSTLCTRNCKKWERAFSNIQWWSKRAWWRHDLYSFSVKFGYFLRRLCRTMAQRSTYPSPSSQLCPITAIWWASSHFPS